MTPGRSQLVADLLNQTAVYWSNPVNDGYGGRTFDAPAEISVRWENKQELFIDAEGREVRSNAVVYVNQDVSTGEYLYFGALSDLSSVEEDDPLSVTGAYEIRSYGETPRIDAGAYVRKVWL